MTAKQKIQALISAANETTGELDLDLTTAVKTLIEGYGGSGDVRPYAASVSPDTLPKRYYPASFGNYNYFSSFNVEKPLTFSPVNIRSGIPMFGTTGTFSAASTISSGQQAAVAGSIKSGFSAFIDGEEVKGSMGKSTNSGLTMIPGTSRKTAISGGKYASSAIYVAGDVDLVPENIKNGVTIFNVTGTYQGGGQPASAFAYVRCFSEYEDLADTVECLETGMTTPADTGREFVFPVPSAGTYTFNHHGTFDLDYEVTVTNKYSLVNLEV